MHKTSRSNQCGFLINPFRMAPVVSPFGKGFDPSVVSPSGAAARILTNSNRTLQATATGGGIKGFPATAATGTKYFEIVFSSLDTSVFAHFGLSTGTLPDVWTDATSEIVTRQNGQVFANGTVYLGGFGALLVTDIFGFSYDHTTRSATFFKNGAGIVAGTLDLAGECRPVVWTAGGSIDICSIRTKAGELSYAPAAAWES